MQVLESYAMSPADVSGDLRFDAWSQRCAERMSHRQDCVSGSFETARDQILAITDGRCRFSASRRNAAEGFACSQVRIGGTALQLLSWTSEDAHCETATLRPPGGNVILYIPLQGSFEAWQGSHAAAARPGTMLAVSSHGNLRRAWSGSLVLLNLLVPVEVLTRTLSDDFHVAAAKPLRFEPMATLAVERADTLLRYIDMLLCDLDSAHPVFAARPAAAQAERTLLHILLRSIPGGYPVLADEQEPSIAPYFVKRAEDFVRTHIHKELAIGAVAQACGVSVRTLFYGFQRFRCTTPARFIKNERLSLARLALLRARSRGCKVAEIAVQFGYTNPSQFSRDYKQRFGESPLSTLRPDRH